MSGFSQTDTRDVSTAAIPGNTQSNLRTAWLSGVFWNLISAPLLVIIPREIERNHLAAIGFLFPIIGVGLLAWNVITTMRWRRFGASRFEMGPATLGGQLSGTIHTRLNDVQSIRVTLKLTCLHRLTRGSGEDRDTRENILWREEYVVPEGQVGLGGLGASIPVRFAIPADARETTAVGQSDGIVWVLAAEVSLPGVDFKEDFDVPVRRGESTATVESTPTDAFEPARAPISPTELAASGIHITPTPEGTATLSWASGAPASVRNEASRDSICISACSRADGPALRTTRLERRSTLPGARISAAASATSVTPSGWLNVCEVGSS